ncbi:hypothetical protein GA0074696_6025 [Micromonospora purpureochromogenes]|uniref:Phosphotransferase enzyme family protein n=1 Tax=Micromonospora purpureochromogenes TaxID=47872 RepID=A0A1C5AH95_9ACTN|nr:hypothetical protein [Micromonospora purpureochromogenes]SCF44585.1 hypothetical protein GA0074696_6025 [Micromonospora purpureochromogenes]
MFVEARTRPVLAEVCRRLDMSDAGASLLRHHTNAVYAVGDMVVKIAPVEFGLERTHAVVTVVQWLAARGFPTVGLIPWLPQPLLVGEHAVTVWQRLDPAYDSSRMNHPGRWHPASSRRRSSPWCPPGAPRAVP